jgi:hypothetical protein
MSVETIAFVNGDFEQYGAPSLSVRACEKIIFEDSGEIPALRQEFGCGQSECIGDIGDVMRGGVLNFEESDKVFMEINDGLGVEDLSGDFVVLRGLFIQVHSKEDHDLISLKVLFSTIELFVVLKQVSIQIKSLTLITLVQNGQHLINQLSLNNLNRIQHEHLNLLQVGRLHLMNGLFEMDNIGAQEAEVNLGGDLLINALIDVVTLVGGFGLAAFKVLVELVVVFE